MSGIERDPLNDLWRRVLSMPPDDRLSLASRIIQSLEQERTISEKPAKSLADLLGLLETVDPPPTDEECDQIVKEELMRKYQ